jgi:hypothetical protein
MVSSQDRIEFLTKTSTLWVLFIAFVALMHGSDLMKAHWSMELLDGISNPADARALLAGMTPEQKSGHLWFTTTLDVLLPIAAVGLFVGMALVSFPKYGKFLAIPPLLALPLDYIEGVVQVLVLTETADVLAVKAFTTPIKSICYQFGFFISLIGLLKLLALKLKSVFVAMRA